MNRRSFLAGLMAAPVAAVMPAVTVASAVGVGRGAATLFEVCRRVDRDLMAVAVEAERDLFVGYLPDPSFRLFPTGERTYKEWCSALLKRNMLTKQTLGVIEKLAVNSDEICRHIGLYYEDKTHKIPHDLVLEKRALFLELLTLTPDGALDQFKVPVSKGEPA